jgi:hypothetical protein
LSWSYSVQRTKAENFAEAADAALEAAGNNKQLQNNTDAADEAAAAARKAGEVAKELVEGGYAGNAYVSASMGGHAEADNSPSKGSIYMTVSVYGHDKLD